MWTYWFSVLWRAVIGSLETIGQTIGTLGFAGICIAISLGVSWYRHGFTAMKTDIFKTVLEALVVGLIAWAPFLIWHLFRTPYLITQEKEQQASALAQELDALRREAETNVALTIGGVVLIQGTNPPTLQLTVEARNTGRETTLDQWRLVLKWRGTDYQTRHLIGQQKAAGSLDLLALDDRVSSSPFVGTVQGLLFFSSPLTSDQTKEAFNGAISGKEDITLRLTGTDKSDRQWSGERSVAELAAEQVLRSKGREPIRR